MSKISDAVELFLGLKAYNTKRSYRSIIDDFESCAGELERVSGEQAMKYFANLKNKDQAGATIQLKFQALNSIYNYLLDLELVTKNPLRPVRRAISWRDVAQRRPTALLPFGAVRKLLRLPGNPRNEVRDRALLAVLFGAGLRRSEALGLDIGAVKVSPEGVVFLEILKSKSGKRQARPLAKFAWKYLSRYISRRKGEGATESDPVFVFRYADGRPRARMSERTCHRIFTNACKKLGIKAAPHAARATFATRLHQITGSDLLTADGLGHSGPSQIRKYVKARDLSLSNWVKKLDYF